MPRSSQAMNEPVTDRRVRILMIDALVLFRASLARILSVEPDLEVAGECATPAEALKILSTPSGGPIDLILLDFDLGAEHANDFMPAARETGYEGRFLIVAGTVDARNAALALRLGASGIFLKSDRPQRLLQVIRTVMDGDVWVDRTIIQLLANQLIDRLPKSEIHISGEYLGSREKKVLLSIMQGLSNRQIGASLGISESSAKNIVQHLFAMTGVRTRSQLVRMAFEGSLGAVHPDTKSETGEAPGHASRSS